MNDELMKRIAVLSRLVKRTQGASLGRTAIMKLAYFLTVLRDVPLGYRFSLYSYGPFDSTVLQDVDFGSSLGALRSQPVRYPSGDGYLIQPGSSSDEIELLEKDFLDAHETAIDWVATEFGNLTAAELELLSTIVYVDREFAGTPISKDDLARRVHDIKPHFLETRTLSRIEDLKTKGLLSACAD
jgi:hypothetical protein